MYNCTQSEFMIYSIEIVNVGIGSSDFLQKSNSVPWDALLLLGFKLNLYIGLCHTCNSDKMVDHVLHSHISMIDSIHAFKNPSQETFCL